MSGSQRKKFKSARDRETRNTDGYALYDAFLGGTITDEQYSVLEKRTQRIDYDELDDVLQETLGSSTRRPIMLSGGGGGTRIERTGHTLVDSIDPALLFDQSLGRVTTSFTRQHTKRQFLLHNFDATSVYYQRLYEWVIFKDVTELMMRPLFYLIGCGVHREIAPVSHTNNNNRTKKARRGGVTLPASTMAVVTPTTPIESHSLSAHELQHKMAQSCHAQSVLNCRDLVESAENVTGASLLKLFVRETHVIFVFEWTENASFMFFLSFDFIRPGWNKKEYDGETLLVLHSKDLLADYTLDEDDSTNVVSGTLLSDRYTEKQEEYARQEADKRRFASLSHETKKKNTRRTSGVRQKKTVSMMNPFTGQVEQYDDDDDEEEEEEEEEVYDDSNIMTYDYKRKNTVFHIGSGANTEDPTDFVICFYGARINRHFMNRLKDEFITYRAYGYIKNDNTTF